MHNQLCVSITRKANKAPSPPWALCLLMGDHPMGPIGHLLVSLHQVGAHLIQQLLIIQEQETPISIRDTPWQQLRPQIEQMGQ